MHNARTVPTTASPLCCQTHVRTSWACPWIPAPAGLRWAAARPPACSAAASPGQSRTLDGPAWHDGRQRQCRGGSGIGSPAAACRNTTILESGCVCACAKCSSTRCRPHMPQGSTGQLEPAGRRTQASISSKALTARRLAAAPNASSLSPAVTLGGTANTAPKMRRRCSRRSAMTGSAPAEWMGGSGERVLGGEGVAGGKDRRRLLRQCGQAAGARQQSGALHSRSSSQQPSHRASCPPALSRCARETPCAPGPPAPAKTGEDGGGAKQVSGWRRFREGGTAGRGGGQAVTAGH